MEKIFSTGVAVNMIKLIKIAEKHGETKDVMAAHMAASSMLITCTMEKRLQELWAKHGEEDV